MSLRLISPPRHRTPAPVLLVLGTFIACFSSSLFAQLETPTTSPSSAAQQINERLEAARRRVASGQSSLLSAQQARSGEALQAKASEASARGSQPMTPAVVAQAEASEQRLNAAIRNISPAGRDLLAQASPAVPVAVVVDDTPTAAKAPSTSKPAPAGGPQPQAIKPLPVAPAAKANTDTVITANELYFDGSGSIAVYVGNVDVKKPGLHITCDELEVHMKKEAKPAASAPVAKAATGKPATPLPASALSAAPATLPGEASKEAPRKPGSQDNIETAVAKGRLVVIEKVGEGGEVQIGQCREATFEGATGNVILRVNPQVQKGNSIIMAAEETCVMVLTEGGDFKAFGRTKSVLADQKDKDGNPIPTKGGGLSLPAPPPGQ